MAKLRFSLATKCQIGFGMAVVLILVAALSVPWLRMEKLVRESQRQTASRLAEVLLDNPRQLDQLRSTGPPAEEDEFPLRFRLIDRADLAAAAEKSSFLAHALGAFTSGGEQRATSRIQRGPGGRWIYRYARAVRPEGAPPPGEQTADARQAPPEAILLIEMGAEWAEDQVLINRIWLANAGLFAGLLAITVFWFILTRIVLSPVRVLRETAEKAAEGDLRIRSDINTGDEFEQLSETFNTMLANLQAGQDQLRQLNKQLDLKLGRMAESNLSLHEANRIKGDFLANVSHELRTPLNSIIGFAEVLAESPDSGDTTPPQKRRRYVENILISSRLLLQMINELLDLAKIEAGRVDLNIDRMPVADTCEGLLNLIRPQADRKRITLSLALARRLPMIQTDPGKFQQIIFNFLSNAVKFTPEGGRIELGAAVGAGEEGRSRAESSQLPHAAADPIAQEDQSPFLRVWVSDTGPGIPPDQHEAIFDKFRQLDSSHTKQHGGTGLGLAICRDLARLLDGRIRLDSEIRRGSTFTLLIPLTIKEKADPLMP